MNGGEPLGARMARRWAHLYTHGLPVGERERRCLERESDLWEHLDDPHEPNATTVVFGRFLRGIPAVGAIAALVAGPLVSQQQFDMTRTWFVWLGAGAVLFGIGWIPLVIEGDELSWGYFIWILGWRAAVRATFG